MSNLPGIIVLLIGCLAVLVGAKLAGVEIQPDELDQEQALYCEMVTTHKATGGEYGWPDYKGVYAEACE